MSGDSTFIYGEEPGIALVLREQDNGAVLFQVEAFGASHILGQVTLAAWRQKAVLRFLEEHLRRVAELGVEG